LGGVRTLFNQPERVGEIGSDRIFTGRKKTVRGWQRKNAIIEDDKRGVSLRCGKTWARRLPPKKCWGHTEGDRPGG